MDGEHQDLIRAFQEFQTQFDKRQAASSETTDLELDGAVSVLDASALAISGGRLSEAYKLRYPKRCVGKNSKEINRLASKWCEKGDLRRGAAEMLATQAQYTRSALVSRVDAAIKTLEDLARPGTDDNGEMRAERDRRAAAMGVGKLVLDLLKYIHPDAPIEDTETPWASLFQRLAPDKQSGATVTITHTPGRVVDHE